MILLALDTAMAACSAAVLRADGAVLAQAFVPMEKGHAEALAPMVAALMEEAGISFADLGRLAVTVGPGTFTGVRIGLSFARGLGVALGLPVFGVDSLSAIAANGAGPRLVVCDARKDEVYTALLAADGQSLRGPAVVPLAQAVAGVPEGTWVLGTAADQAVALAPTLRRDTAGDLPVAAVFGRLGFVAPVPAAMPAPLYLRPADAKPQAGYAPRVAPRQITAVGAAAASVVSQMHGECFDHPWTEQACAALMGQTGALTLVAQEGAEPTGFLLARQAADEAEIITLGTRPFAQRRGAAKALLAEAIAALAARGAARLFLEVAAGNMAARALYHACGFEEAGLRKGYYDRGDGRREDALVLQRALSP